MLYVSTRSREHAVRARVIGWKPGRYPCVSRHSAVSRDTARCLETQGCVSRHRAVSRDTALCLETQPGVSFTGFAGFAYILFNVVYLLLLSVNMVFVSNFIVFYVKKYPFTDLVLLPPIFPGSCEGRIRSVWRRRARVRVLRR